MQETEETQEQTDQKIAVEDLPVDEAGPEQVKGGANFNVANTKFSLSAPN